VLDETRRMSLQLLKTLFIFGRERELKWMVKECGVFGVIRRVREKEERN
jgi:hypothetical protein